MILAAGGLPTWWVVVATMVGGTLAAGSANALNCYVDRDIDAADAPHRAPPAGPRTRSRRTGALRLRPGARRRRRRGRWALVTNWLAAGLTAAAIAFYVVVYTMLLKRRTVAEHRLGRRRRLHAGADRLVRGHRLAGLGAGRPVRRRVLLDAAALLGPGHPLPRGLLPRRRADAARRRAPQRVAREIVVYAWLTALCSLALWPLATGWVYGVLAAVAGVGAGRAAHRLLSRTARGRGRQADAAVPPVEQLPGLRVRRGRASTSSSADRRRPAGRCRRVGVERRVCIVSTRTATGRA